MAEALRRVYDQTKTRKKRKRTGEDGEEPQPTCKFYKTLQFPDPIIRPRHTTTTNIPKPISPFLEDEAASTVSPFPEDEEDLEWQSVLRGRRSRLSLMSGEESEFAPTPTPAQNSSDSRPSPLIQTQKRHKLTADDSSRSEVYKAIVANLQTLNQTSAQDQVDCFAKLLGTQIRKL